MCFRRVANCLVVAMLKTKSPHESAHPRTWRRIRLRKSEEGRGREERSKLHQAWFYSIYVGRKQDELYAGAPLKKYKACMCIFLTPSENIIVKVFSINWEWDKTNTVSELLHFLWSNIYIYVYMWPVQWLSLLSACFTLNSWKSSWLK